MVTRLKRVLSNQNRQHLKDIYFSFSSYMKEYRQKKTRCITKFLYRNIIKQEINKDSS